MQSNDFLMPQAASVKPEHSPIGASSMYRWKKCPGSVRMSKGIKSISSKYADEGTRAHEQAAQLLLNGGWNVGWNEEDTAAIQSYVDIVQKTKGELKVEVKFDLKEIHKGLYGTADAVVYDKEAKILRVFDYKHGKGIEVEAEDNEQLQYYGLGALLSTGYPCKTVELIIVQPRFDSSARPDKRWSFDAIELINFSDTLEKAAQATEDEKAPLVSGDHCHFCPAAGICPKLREEALQTAQRQFSPITNYDPKELSDTLNKLEMLESYAKSVRAFAYNEAGQGRCPPGFKLVEKRAMRKWSIDEVTIASRLDLLGVAEPYDRSLKSPAQIEKLLSKESKKEINDMVAWVSSGTTLVPIDDPRPGVTSIEMAQKLFEPVTALTELT